LVHRRKEAETQSKIAKQKTDPPNDGMRKLIGSEEKKKNMEVMQIPRRGKKVEEGRYTYIHPHKADGERVNLRKSSWRGNTDKLFDRGRKTGSKHV